MKERGRGEYCQSYLRMLESLADHRRLDQGKDMQTLVSCLFKDGELDITTYLGAEAFHSARLEQRSRQGTLRRGDD